MSDKKAMLKAKIASHTTETLLDVVRTLNTRYTTEEMLVCSMATCELESRLSEIEFSEFLAELDAELSAA
jgi:hypothetical protein